MLSHYLRWTYLAIRIEQESLCKYTVHERQVYCDWNDHPNYIKYTNFDTFYVTNWIVKGKHRNVKGKRPNIRESLHIGLMKS